MEKIDTRLSINRALHPRNGRARKSVLYARVLGPDNSVKQFYVHSLGNAVDSATLISNYGGEVRRSGNVSELISRTESPTPMRPLALADLKKSRGIAERELRRLLAQP